MLDYEDLIFHTDKLLAQEQMMAWVRWKLDKGISHLLIDEAQDTSPAQWSLLDKLSAPFLTVMKMLKAKLYLQLVIISNRYTAFKVQTQRRLLTKCRHG